MPASFFGVAELPTVTRVPSETQCEKCKLYKGCLSPKMQASGRGKRKILILAEAPGAEEDQSGIQLVGNSGRELAKHLAAVGIDLRRDCILENALMCHPPDNKITNGRMIEWCRPHVLKTIRQEEPEVIIPLGATAVESLLRYTWKDEDIGGIGRWAGYRIPDQKLNAWVCPTFHPAHVLRAKEPIYGQLFAKHLEAAADLKGRPWKEVPDYRKDVQVIKSPDEAARRLALIRNDDIIAFDFETNMLKPDSAGARIVCCSVCVNGLATFAFPWHGRAIDAAKLILQNKRIKKVGWNCFSGETKFLTREHGVVSLKKVVGTEVTVLNHEGKWVKGKVRKYGTQKLVKTVFSRRNYLKEVWCTYDHDWISADSSERIKTKDLRSRIYSGKSYKPNSVPYLNAPKDQIDEDDDYREGIRHGAILGDGWKVKGRRGKYQVRLCGSKKGLLPYFDGFTVSYPPSYKGDPVVYLNRQAVDLKKPPKARLVSDSYILGFARGLIATDGCVNYSGQISLSNSEEVIKWCKRHLPRVGFSFQGEHGTIKYAGKYKGQYNQSREVITLYFSRESVQKSDLLKKEHRKNYKPVDMGPFKFKERTGEHRTESVYCVEVDDGSSFTLDNGLVTGNCKFESRWCRRFGIKVRGWVWDGMLAAHALHCGGKGRAVTGAKFQAYVHLGFPDYDSQIKPYLKAKGGNELNRIDQVDLDSLMLYCGLDSLVEYKTGALLRKEMLSTPEE